MSSASFGTVNATGLNVTGVLQASEIRTTRPVQVSNLTSTGLATLTNVAISGSVQGNLNVTGNVIAQNINAIETQNTNDRLAFNTDEVFARDSSTTRYVNPTHWLVKPINTVITVPLLDEEGVPTTVLTENTSWNDPLPLDNYNNPAPLVKINDNGTFGYINVAATSITDICSNLIPAAANTWSMVVTTDNDSFTGTTGTNFGFEVVSDWAAQAVAWQAKRGFPLSGKSGVKGYNTSHVFYQDCMVAGSIVTAEFLTDNMCMGLDVNGYINGTGTVDLYLAGGIRRALPIALPGTDWSNTYAIPALTLPVTTNGAEYQYKVSAGQTVVYLNTALNVLNFNIVDFGDYHFDFPAESTFSSNVVTCTPTTFVASFGFYCNGPPTLKAGTSSPTVIDDGVRYLKRTGTKTTQSTIENAEYLIQISDTLTFTFVMSDTVTPTTLTIPRHYTALAYYYQDDPPVQFCTAWTLPRYNYRAGVNYSVNMIAGTHIEVYETQGLPLTQGDFTGQNENLPYLPNLRRGTTGSAYMSTGYGPCVLIDDIDFDPEEQKIVPAQSRESNESVFPAFIHEYMHTVQTSMGMNPWDAEYNIFDDELLAYIVNGQAYRNMYYSGHLVNRMRSARDSYLLANGQNTLYFRSNRDMINVLFSGTNIRFKQPFEKGTGFSGASAIKPMFEHSACITSSYDPNAQHIKLLYYEFAKKLANAPKHVLYTIEMNARDQSNATALTSRTVNPSIVSSAFESAIVETGMHYSGGTPISSGVDLHEETCIQIFLSRNNAAIPDKYKCNYKPSWFESSYVDPSISFRTTLGVSIYDDYFDDMSSLHMRGWDFLQTNEDTYTVRNRPVYSQPVMPWWPKNITGVFGGLDSYGQQCKDYFTGVITPYTQDSTYKAMSNVSLSYTSNVVRHMYSLGTVGYALPVDLSNVTVQLQEPTLGGSYDGGYNSNISVCVFKYIPERCATGVLSNVVAHPTCVNGAFMMQGPFKLSKTGTTSHTFDLTANIHNGVNGTFSTTTSNIADNTIAFNHVFPYSVDDGTVYTPSAHATAYATHLGMTGGAYQPVTRLFIVDKHVSAFNFSDGDIQSKLFLDQIKPSCVKISVNGQP